MVWYKADVRSRNLTSLVYAFVFVVEFFVFAVFSFPFFALLPWPLCGRFEV